MEPGDELLYRDKESLSPHAAKVYACVLLAAFLLVLIVVIYNRAEWNFFVCMTAVLSFSMLFMLGSGSTEIWVSDGCLYRKRVPFNFIEPKRIPLKDIKGASIQPTFDRNKPYVVILNLRNREDIEFVMLQSHKQSVELETIISNRLPGGPEKERGEEFLKNGDSRRAIHEFDRAIVANPDDIDAFLLRSWAKQLDKDLQGALEDLSEAIRLTPDEGMLYMHRSVLHNQMAMWEEARTDLERHAQLLPSVTTHPNFLDYKKQLEQKTGCG